MLIQLHAYDDNKVIYSLDIEDNNISKTLISAIKDNIDLTCLILSNATLININFNNCKLSTVLFENCIIDNCSFKGANLYGSVFNDCIIIRSNFRKAILKSITFRRCSLSYVYCGFANLRYALFNGTEPITECDFSNSDLTKAIINNPLGEFLCFNNTCLSSVKGIIYAYCAFNGHGENGRQLTGVLINNEVIYYCGCFTGNAEKLKKYIKEGDKDYRKSRTIAMNTVAKLIKL